MICKHIGYISRCLQHSFLAMWGSWICACSPLLQIYRELKLAMDGCWFINKKLKASTAIISHNFEASSALGVCAPLKRIAVEEHDKKEHSTRPDICRLPAVSRLGARNHFWRCTKGSWCRCRFKGSLLRWKSLRSHRLTIFHRTWAICRRFHSNSSPWYCPETSPYLTIFPIPIAQHFNQHIVLTQEAIQ